MDEALFKAILDRLDFTESQHEMNVKDFSNGQKKKVFLAGSLCQEAHLYIWDEPLNKTVGDSRIRRYKKILEGVKDNGICRLISTNFFCFCLGCSCPGKLVKKISGAVKKRIVIKKIIFLYYSLCTEPGLVIISTLIYKK